MTTTGELTITDPTILAYRARIAELREQRNHLIASIMRDELICQIEAFVDPIGIAHADELRALQCRKAAVDALDIDELTGF